MLLGVQKRFFYQDGVRGSNELRTAALSHTIYSNKRLLSSFLAKLFLLNSILQIDAVIVHF